MYLLCTLRINSLDVYEAHFSFFPVHTLLLPCECLLLTYECAFLWIGVHKQQKITRMKKKELKNSLQLKAHLSPTFHWIIHRTLWSNRPHPPLLFHTFGFVYHLAAGRNFISEMEFDYTFPSPHPKDIFSGLEWFDLHEGWFRCFFEGHSYWTNTNDRRSLQESRRNSVIAAWKLLYY